MMGNDPEAQFKATLEVRKMLSKEKDPPVREVLAAGLLPRLVQLLATGDAKLQFEAAWYAAVWLCARLPACVCGT